MRLLLSRCLALLAGAVLSFSPLAGELPAARIDAYMDAQLQQRRIPGAALAVIAHGRPMLVKGYGLANVEHRVPVGVDTVFQSGSVGKQFTAAAVMLLVQDGKLGLDDPVRRFFPAAPPAWRRVTVRHLLSHTAGLPDDWPAGFDLRRDYADAELTRRILAMPLDAAPGARYRYSNPGYVLLGMLVGKASGRFYGDLLQERLFGPLGMATARVIDEADIVPGRAAGYRLDGGRLKNQEWVSPSLNRTADGSLYLGLADWIAWDAALGKGWPLRPDSLAQLWQPMRLADGRLSEYGLGWELDSRGGHPRVWHDGAWQGFESYLSRRRDGSLSVVLLVNLAEAGVADIAEGLLDLLAAEGVGGAAQPGAGG
ncbi:serine hydrolase domain-containing protein [Chitinimonas koreensis]|uniref:serine hydrolase domain-containing protein n=1 Tax=Chitinimonas koreensis TaxID=356302 RepID=UPI0004044A7A|nr:serine hydrolase domain-containing protein [Chitinimonas koreensis]QNM96137.1 beta-lactamase family protein [Chitinimonas koreensis]